MVSIQLREGGFVIVRTQRRHRRLACRLGRTCRMPVPPATVWGRWRWHSLDSRFHVCSGDKRSTEKIDGVTEGEVRSETG
jgi:hypothetical protein